MKFTAHPADPGPLARDGAGNRVKNLGLARPGDQSECETLLGFVKVNQAVPPLDPMGQLLKVSRYGFHAAQGRLMAKRAKIETVYTGLTRDLWKSRVHPELRTQCIWAAWPKPSITP